VPIERPRHMETGDIQRALKFDCGTFPVLNTWIQNHAWASHQGGGARVYVAIETAQDLIASYFCLSAAHVEREGAPPRMTHGMGQSPIPVTLIGRFAVDSRFAGEGLGKFMIRCAFETISRAADLVGVRAIIVDAKGPKAVEFYQSVGFTPFIGSNPDRLFIMMKEVRRALSAAQSSPAAAAP
jgi:GNAT superfamily N-acetyltransferase